MLEHTIHELGKLAISNFEKQRHNISKFQPMFTFVLLIVGVTSTLGDDLNVVVSTYGSAAMRLRICHQSEGTHCIDDLPGGIKPSHTSTKSISSATAGGTLSYGNMVAHLKVKYC